jgi:hypothetical protein
VKVGKKWRQNRTFFIKNQSNVVYYIYRQLFFKINHNQLHTKKMVKYICSNNSEHEFDSMTADGFCSKEECYGIGFLVEQQGGSLDNADFSPESRIREIGLCILLMDASGSMQSTAFDSSPATKDKLVAGSASGGIFELEQLSNKDDAYVIAVMFDTSNTSIFSGSIAEIFSKFKSASEFSKFILESFKPKYGGTDINGALNYAKEIYDNFTQNNDLSKYGGPKNVKPVKQSVLAKNGEQKIVPNVRVLIYTDGEATINGNPFKSSNEVDILMGAFFGKGGEAGCNELKSIVSKCPIHEVDQFFLINDPNRIQTMKKLFRMASGTSGFCPVCLAQD